MIPKTIHYCWFGGKRKPKLVRDCIASWKKYLPDYHIIEWNEKNSDLSHPFVQTAYIARKWAFVADYIRLKVIYEHGGIYLDTDMMVLKSFDSLLINQCFFGAEDFEYINAGIIGSKKGHDFIGKCLLRYDSLLVDQDINWYEITVPKIITTVFRNINNFHLFFEKEIKNDDIVVYPPSYFYPILYNEKEKIRHYKKHISLNSFTVHFWGGSWIEHSEFYYFRNKEYAKGFRQYFKFFSLNKIKIKYLKKMASCIKSSLIK
ncbi:MAG: hypothetical protein RLZZ540_317 [Bacteroidota bacterium]|jgi:mannosyltransferase OCH1-like enzyme